MRRVRLSYPALILNPTPSRPDPKLDPKPDPRRSLRHVGGRADTAGDPADCQALAHALDVPPADPDAAADGPDRVHVHGFHTYPARMHPVTAARLVTAFAPEHGRVLDPFCGSGTVLVAALVNNRRAAGTDLNPLAVRLARGKTRFRPAAELANIAAAAREVAAHADARRKAKAGATRRHPPADVGLFAPHVLLELDGLRDGIDRLPAGPARDDLWLVLSAVLVKFSDRRADTASGVVRRNTAAGAAARWFVRKADDWAARLAEFGRRLPAPPPPPAWVGDDDATALTAVPPGPVAAVVTSPPYAATYDYVAHHELRLRWLNLDSARLARSEIGSRAAYAALSPAAAQAAWTAELARFLTAAGKWLAPGGPAVLVIGDSAVGGVALRADAIVADAARAAGFVPAARASQTRPHFHRPTTRAFADRPRAEHALLLRRARTPA